MISSRTIVDAMSTPTSTMSQGAALYGARQAGKFGSGSGTPAQRQFFDALTSVAPTTVAPTYNHPGTAPLPIRPNGPLTPAELVWLQRLPLDPAQVSYADAQQLAAMTTSLAGDQANRDSQQLVDSVWSSVRDVHDRAAAQIELTNAEQPQPALPDATAALADAIAGEQPTLTRGEALGRATTMLTDARAARDTQHAQRLDQARDRVDRLNQSIADRTALVKA